MDVCGRIAHEWPKYSPIDVQRLPWSTFRALRALYIRAHSMTVAETEQEGIDVDELLGITDEDEKDRKVQSTKREWARERKSVPRGVTDA